MVVKRSDFSPVPNSPRALLHHSIRGGLAVVQQLRKRVQAWKCVARILIEDEGVGLALWAT